MASPKSFVTLGMFIIDEFLYMDENGLPTGRTLEPQGSAAVPFDPMNLGSDFKHL